jgi:hypothetical protein
MIVKLKQGLIGIWGTCRPDSGIYQSVRPVTHLESRANSILKVHDLKREYRKMLRVELSEEHESLQLEPRSCRSHGRHIWMLKHLQQRGINR